mgnify:CR=1
MSHEPPLRPSDLEDYLSSSPGDKPTPEWHTRIIAERLEKYRDGDEDRWRTWEEFEQELD